MKVAFYLENEPIADVDLSRPELGNPGCGGTEYLFSALPFYLSRLSGGACAPYLLANSTAHLPPRVPCAEVRDVYHAMQKAKADGCDVFVYRPKRQSEMDVPQLADELELPTVFWIHVVPTSAYMRIIAKSTFVRAFVCVEQEQHDTLYDTPICSKLTYIVNGFDVDGFRSDLGSVEKDPNMVIHIGTLVPQKNFHLVARAWPQILAQHPAARLVVIGSAGVYGSNVRHGPWGVAEEGYEKTEIIPYLGGGDGHPLPSVKFMGKMGIEKKKLLAQAIVGIPNPTGDNENCPGTNLELSAAGTAVVSGARYGSLDTVVHGKTGLLGNSQAELINNVVWYLQHPNEAIEAGRQGVQFVRSRYAYQSVVNEWCGLLKCVSAGTRIPKKPFKCNLYKHQKIIRVLNRPVQSVVGKVVVWPSFNEVKEAIHRLKYVGR